MTPRTPQRHDRRLRWGDGWIEPRTNVSGDVRFVARWPEERATGDRVWRGKTFDSQGDAERWLAKKADDKAAGRPLDRRDLTVSAMVSEWIERRHNVKAATRVNYRKHLKGAILPAFGKTLAADLTPHQVQRWVDTLVKSGLAAGTIHVIVAVIKGAYKDAIRLRIVEANPASGVTLPRIQRTEMVTWSAEDIALAMTHLRDQPLWRTLYRVALATGIRPGELITLRWADIEPGGGMLAVRRTVTRDDDQKEIVGSSTKGNRDRAIALPASIAADLKIWAIEQKRQRLAAKEWTAGDYVFSTPRGERLGYLAFYRFHRTMVAELGLPPITPHGMRHTSASLELEAGTHPKIVSDRLGHRSIQTTIDMYSHVSADLQRAAAEALDARMFGDSERTNTTTQAS